MRLLSETLIGFKGVNHRDGRVDFDGFSVEKSGSVAPLVDRFDGGVGKVGVNLAVHDAQRKRLAVHTDHGTKNDSAADASRSSGFGINGLDFRDDFGRLDTAADTEA